jgi:hypothetical protein
VLVVGVVFAWHHAGEHVVGAFHHDAAVVVNGRTPAGEVANTVPSPLVGVPGVTVDSTLADDQYISVRLVPCPMPCPVIQSRHTLYSGQL